MLELLNRIFLVLLLLVAGSAILISIVTLALPSFLGTGFDLKELESASHASDFYIRPQSIPLTLQPTDSPSDLEFTIHSPVLEKTDTLSIKVFSQGKQLSETDCLKDLGSYGEYSSLTSFICNATMPYDYSSSNDYLIFASRSGGSTEVVSDPVSVHSDWTIYEANFWGFSWLLGIFIVGVYLFIAFPLTIFVLKSASGMKHNNSLPGEYSLTSLFNPFSVGKTLLEKVNSFLVSPYFWAIESVGILVIVMYLAISSEIWKSGTALIAFIFSGLLAFLIPFFWCLIWWYADYREREPLRIVITFFLWGMLAALMAIGINTIAGDILGLVGLGFLSTFLLAPPLEEFFKGSGICLLSEHHEFDSIEDGVVFGFIIGMGFSFIEDWLYMLNNPMGSDIWSWLGLFFLRSIIFSSNHGLYTAITGGIIGFLIERRFRAPALGLLIGVPIAGFFHAMHNSGEALQALLGSGGLLVYCCLLIPLFDYGGLIVLIGLFIYAVVRKKPGKKSGK